MTDIKSVNNEDILLIWYSDRGIIFIKIMLIFGLKIDPKNTQILKAFNQKVRQDIKTFFEDIYMEVKIYWISFASLRNSRPEIMSPCRFSKVGTYDYFVMLQCPKSFETKIATCHTRYMQFVSNSSVVGVIYQQYNKSN